MNYLYLTMRLLHILFGVFWAGTIIFNAIFLGPSLREAGPHGSTVFAGLVRRNFPIVLPITAVINMLAGVYLLWKVSAGFQPAYFRTATGMAFSSGALLAIVAFAIGIVVMRPAMLGAMAMGQAAAQAPPAERDQMLDRAKALGLRAAKASRIIAMLLTLAVAAMAVGRYV
jgi:uncharacterized membrane protein